MTCKQQLLRKTQNELETGNMDKCGKQTRLPGETLLLLYVDRRSQEIMKYNIKEAVSLLINTKHILSRALTAMEFIVLQEMSNEITLPL